MRRRPVLERFEEETEPQLRISVPEGALELPELWNTVKTLDQTIDVDYYLPGCPPEPPQIWAVLEVVVAALTQGGPLPPKGSVIGVGKTAVCDECPLEKHEKQIARFYRPYEIIPEPGMCLLDQGIVCMGPATVSGCGALCPQVGMRCEGCYGPLEGVVDQGGKMLSAIASVIAAGKPGTPEHELEREINAVVDTLVDPAGTFYRFSMAHSLLGRTRTSDGEGKGDAR